MGKSNFQLAGCCDADGGIPVTSSFRSTSRVLLATARRDRTTTRPRAVAPPQVRDVMARRLGPPAEWWEWLTVLGAAGDHEWTTLLAEAVERPRVLARSDDPETGRTFFLVPTPATAPLRCHHRPAGGRTPSRHPLIASPHCVAATVAGRTTADQGVSRIPLPPPRRFAPSRTASPSGTVALTCRFFREVQAPSRDRGTVASSVAAKVDGAGDRLSMGLTAPSG
jgi:hypothetical protein